MLSTGLHFASESTGVLPPARVALARTIDSRWRTFPPVPS